MKRTAICLSAGMCLLLFTAVSARAGVITENLNAFGVTFSTSLGQSFTTGPATQYFNVAFNFYTQNTTPAGGPVADANQTYFLLDREYLGRSDVLGTETPGFIATTLDVSGNQWFFDPLVTLAGNTQYWLYGSGEAPTAAQFAVGRDYSGGQRYRSGGGPAGNEFIPVTNEDLAFTLNGTVRGRVPGPDAQMLDVRYADLVPPPAGPLPFGLSALPTDVNARFFLSPGTMDPVSSNIVHYGLGDVFSARLPFGDGIWTNLASFKMTATNGIVDSLSYRFSPISTPTVAGGIVMNFPLSITGTNTATGQSFSYAYTSSTQTLTSVVPEPSSLVLAILGLLSLGMIRLRRRWDTRAPTRGGR